MIQKWYTCVMRRFRSDSVLGMRALCPRSVPHSVGVAIRWQPSFCFESPFSLVYEDSLLVETSINNSKPHYNSFEYQIFNMIANDEWVCFIWKLDLGPQRWWKLWWEGWWLTSGPLCRIWSLSEGYLSPFASQAIWYTRSLFLVKLLIQIVSSHVAFVQ